MELKYCPRCVQMTNHNTKGKCLKCRRVMSELKKKYPLQSFLRGMLETRDCFGMQEHKVLTLNTVYKYPIEDPKTDEMRRIKSFGLSCFREGWIHAVSLLQEFKPDQSSPEKIQKCRKTKNSETEREK